MRKMFGLFNHDKAEKVLMPMNGKVVAAAELPDPTFAEEMMGPTVGIEPADGRVYAPFDGVVEMIFDTKHALTLTSKEGVELLIHVGLETVSLQGIPFTAHVEAEQAVQKGDLLLTADLEAIRAAGLKTVTPVVICNADDFKRINKKLQGSKAGDELFTVEK